MILFFKVLFKYLNWFWILKKSSASFATTSIFIYFLVWLNQTRIFSNPEPSSPLFLRETDRAQAFFHSHNRAYLLRVSCAYTGRVRTPHADAALQLHGDMWNENEGCALESAYMVFSMSALLPWLASLFKSLLMLAKFSKEGVSREATAPSHQISDL